VAKIPPKAREMATGIRKLGLHALLREKWRESREGGERGQEDGAEGPQSLPPTSC